MGNLGPDLRPKLPIFGQPELILKATEELRNSDVNQNAIIKLGSVNAGVLPLATENEDDQQLGFFPRLISANHSPNRKRVNRRIDFSLFYSVTQIWLCSTK